MRAALYAIVVSALLFHTGITLAAPGFDCTKAVAAAEREICQNRGLGDQDRQISGLYGSLMETVQPELKNNLRDSQRAFLKQRNACNANVPCLQSQYLWRFHELCGVAKLYGRSCADTGEQPR